MTNGITKIDIISLFGSKSFSITFKDDKLILVGNTGSFKSTILDIVYAVLNGVLQLLKHKDFGRIDVTLRSGDQISISKEDFHDHDKFSKLCDALDCRYDHKVKVHHIIATTQFVIKPRHFTDELYSVLDNYFGTSSKDLIHKVGYDGLSNGQKHLVTMLYDLIIDKDHDHVLVLDDPEAFLDIDLQKVILNDISKLPNCAGLIAATHSPFVFNNGLDQYVYGVNELEIID